MNIENLIISLVVATYGVLSCLIGISVGKSLQKKKKPAKRLKTDIPNCRCTDVNQCDTWCIAKENYSRYHG